MFRLIYIAEFKLVDFHQRIPEYAILSHTWGEDEFTFSDFQSLARQLLPKEKVRMDYLEYIADYVSQSGRGSHLGLHKILGACRASMYNGLEYLWVDTCCIDKSSSTELSESINSMFVWYEGANRCYAHLEDAIITETGVQLQNCRWFTRAWTLQELLAPRFVYFYDNQWNYLGDKIVFAELLYWITQIEIPFLTNQDSIRNASVAKRMSWAANRDATREEDLAYSLLGIFGVNMPLLYGEREKSFIRLQEEILKEIDDHSIFAWKEHEGCEPQKGVRTNCGKRRCHHSDCDITVCRNISCDNPTCVYDNNKDLSLYAKRQIRGLFATSPRYFVESGQIMSFPQADAEAGHIAITNRGIYMPSMLSFVDIEDKKYPVLVLNCWNNNADRPLSIYLHKEAGDQYTRAWPGLLPTFPPLPPCSASYVLKTLSTFRSVAGNLLQNSIFLGQLLSPILVLPGPLARYYKGRSFYPTANQIPYESYLDVCTNNQRVTIWFGTKLDEGKDQRVVGWCRCELLDSMDSWPLMMSLIQSLPGTSRSPTPVMFPQLPIQRNNYSQATIGGQPLMIAQQFPQQRGSRRDLGDNLATLDRKPPCLLQDCVDNHKVELAHGVFLNAKITADKEEGYKTFRLDIEVTNNSGLTSTRLRPFVEAGEHRPVSAQHTSTRLRRFDKEHEHRPVSALYTSTRLRRFDEVGEYRPGSAQHRFIQR